MPQSLSQIIVHVVFSTKNRTPWLNMDIQPEMFSYLSTVLRNSGHTPMIVGGHIDHVHMLFGQSRTEPIAKVVENTKVATSKWIKSKGTDFSDFSWQRGYGAFGISYAEADKAIAYIANQEIHHREFSFQDEYRALLEEFGIAFDERYI